MDWTSLLSSGGGGGSTRIAESRAEAGIDYGYTDRRRNDAWLIVAIVAGALVAVAFIIRRK